MSGPGIVKLAKPVQQTTGSVGSHYKAPSYDKGNCPCVATCRLNRTPYPHKGWRNPLSIRQNIKKNLNRPSRYMQLP